MVCALPPPLLSTTDREDSCRTRADQKTNAVCTIPLRRLTPGHPAAHLHMHICSPDSPGHGRFAQGQEHVLPPHPPTSCPSADWRGSDSSACFGNSPALANGCRRMLAFVASLWLLVPPSPLECFMSFLTLGGGIIGCHVRFVEGAGPVMGNFF